MALITAERLRDILIYDPDTGGFTWRRATGAMPAGSPAGCDTGRTYWRIQIAGRTYKAHRLAWLYVTGQWPSHQIDHINGNRADNRFCNLRQATNQQNKFNGGANKNSRTGLRGVTPLRGTRWIARICVNGKQKHIGTFKTPEEAADAYAAYARKNFGEFAESRNGKA